MPLWEFGFPMDKVDVDRYIYTVLLHQIKLFQPVLLDKYRFWTSGFEGGGKRSPPKI